MKSDCHNNLYRVPLNLAWGGGSKSLKINTLRCGVAVLLFIAPLFLTSSCTLNEPEQPASVSEVFSIKCNIEDFVPDVATKVSASASGNSFTATWEDGDAIGVFPDRGGDQVSFSASSGAGTSDCVFDGHGWGLLKNTKYSAYYPYSTDNYGDADAYKAVAVSYIGQRQSEKNVFGVGQFDFMASTNASPVSAGESQDAACTFNFKHLGALIVLDVTFPQAAYLSSVELLCSDNLFVEAGTIDLSQAAPTITPTAKGNSLGLDLDGMSVFANETVRFYILAAPANLTSELPTVKVTTTSGTEMSKKLSSSYNLRAGRAYSLTASLDAPQQATATLKASPAAFFQDWHAREITFRVTANEDYTLTPSDSWISKVSETTVSETSDKTIKEYTYKLSVNNGRNMRSGEIALDGATLHKTVYISQTGISLTVPVAGDGLTIYTTTGNYKYRYGPSIIINDNGTIDAWFASPGSGGRADEFTWRRTSDGGQNWTAEQTVMTGGASGSLDWWSVCDPGAAFFDGYYYMGYTSTTNTSSDGGLQGLENDCFIARSISPSGPWYRWNGSGWGGNAQPIIEYTGPSGKWGIGEPSIVVKDNTIYLYYTYDDGGTPVTKVATADRTNPNWPGSLTFHGTAVDKAALAASEGVSADNPDTAGLIHSYDSCDVKYVEDYDLFYAFHTSWRITANSRLSVWTSADGLNFEYLGDVTGNVVKYAHNMGVSGDGLGHVNLSRTQYVSYAYSPADATDRSHGAWSTYWSTLSY